MLGQGEHGEVIGALREAAALLGVSQDRARAALRLAQKLEVPVRVALVGGAGSGKSTLLTFLLGDRLFSVGLGSPRPPVIVVGAETAETRAGWWGGKRLTFEGKAGDRALAEKPEYVEFALPLPVLENMTFLDLPAARDLEAQSRQLKWVYARADVILWCKGAGESWSRREAQLWSEAPQKIRQCSLLVATGADMLMGERPEAAVERLAQETGGAFHKVLPMATEVAIAAAPGGVVVDRERWLRSGARGLLAALLGQVAAVRDADVAAANALIAAIEMELMPPPADPEPAPRPVSARVPPAPVVEEDAPAPAPRPDPATSAPKVADLREVPPAGTAAGRATSEIDFTVPEGTPGMPDHPALRLLAERIDAILADMPEREAFYDEVGRALDDVSFLVSDRRVMRPDTLWVNDAMEEVAEILMDLRYGGGGEDSEARVATLVLQLSRDLTGTVAA